ncbi:NADP-dependent oxidoreductase [Kitasatospora sp. SUK 42]|uniref:NADP-dependent oxidoreductase n=1 Tax=Kitasatospora sp. SUK 42 TaxID=1588882 RepID=UPI0018CA457E|nr:NADP-dependent oxidoreductase [Kitasatospora sp. SUK 42]MBV2154993.1 NADP-dependent oxidoreductase [Kitasatospora sp. SUK 42]
MKAVIIRSFGGPDVLEVAEVPVPEPGSGQVRIRVAAAAVNPVDVQTRAGRLTAGGLLPEREVIGIGWDVAGTVDALGPGVAGFRPGDAVIGLSDRLALPLKTQAEYVVLDAGAVAAVPAGTDPVAAATLPLGGLTAAQALDIAGAEPGDTLLVTGAAGAVGGYTVQLAALAGLRVVAVADTGDEELVRELGAEFFVPRTADLPAAVRDLVPGGVRAAVDAASVGVLALDAVRGGGSLVSVLGNGPTPLRGTRVDNVWVRADGPRLADLAAAGLRPRIADVLPLDEVAEAHRRLAAGGLRGRLVLVP